MHVSKQGIERLKSANPLEAVVAERGLSLKKKGRTLVARCPFHSPDKTPSLTITPAKGLFHCFGCGAAGDVIGFLTRHDKVTFGQALEGLARRAGLDLGQLMEPQRIRRQVEALTPPPEPPCPEPKPTLGPSELLSRVVEHYHRVFCEREDAQAYLIQRGFTDADLVRTLKVGYADGSLLKSVARGSETWKALKSLGVVTSQGRELLGGCIVVPLPDPVSGGWTSVYGRGLKTDRHCYLPGPLRGVLNFQAARSSDEVVIAESVLDAMSFLQVGIGTAIPIYGTRGFTPDHLDLFKRESVKRVILALDGDAPGKQATQTLKQTLSEAGIAVRVATLPAGITDPNHLLTSSNGNAESAFRDLLQGAEPRETPPEPDTSPLRESPTPTDAGELVLERDGISYRAKPYPVLLGRLRATVKAERGSAFHVDTLDLYASRSRAEFARRASQALNVEAAAVESDLLQLLLAAENISKEENSDGDAGPPPLTESERAEALAFLKRPDLLDQAAADIDALGYVGEPVNTRLLYLVAVSRKLSDPLSAVILSQSGAGKSGITEVIEKLTPPEDVVLLTRLTPQSLYYVAPGFLDRKLVIVEERQGSAEADYSIRVLQSRKKLIAAAPVKDPQSGNLRTKVFTVEARAAFIEATTAASVNHENATRCFELSMDESPEQTQRIHERQRAMRTARGLQLRRQSESTCRRHWNAQRLLEPLGVVIPFAEELSFPTSWMRTRRDHARFLNLIEVSAFLHQHQRQRLDCAVVASVDDYALAYRLAGQLLRETLSDVKRPLREAYERLRTLSNGDGLSRREIREALKLPDSTVRRWLAELVELEYLELEGGASQGKATRYRLTGRGPQDDIVLGLLTPEELRARL